MVRWQKLRLPLRLDILRGRDENSAKSTAAHAAVVAPESTKVWYLPDFPDYADPSRVLLLYPSPTSVPVESLNTADFDAVMVVDTTWQRVGGVMQMPEIANKPFKHVHLSNYHTLFWRHQPLGPGCLSSIEAIYYLFREWRGRQLQLEAQTFASSAPSSGVTAAAARPGGSTSERPYPSDVMPDPSPYYDGAYDDLLLFFIAQYSRVQHEYTEGSKAGFKYNSRMRNGYIKGGNNQAGGSVEAHADGGGGDHDDGGHGGGARGSTGSVGSGDGSGHGRAGGAAPACSGAGPGRQAGKQKRLKSGWAVRTDIMAPEAAAMQRLQNERFLVNSIPGARQGGVVAQPTSADAPSAQTSSAPAGSGDVPPHVSQKAAGTQHQHVGLEVSAFSEMVTKFTHAYAVRPRDSPAPAAAATSAGVIGAEAGAHAHGGADARP